MAVSFINFPQYSIGLYRSGQVNATENNDMPINVGVDKTLVHVMKGGGGTIGMKHDVNGIRSVIKEGRDPFIQQLETLQLSPYHVLSQSVLPKPMDSSCHDAISLHFMAQAVFTAYQHYLQTLPPETDMADPFKLLFPHGTDTLTHVTGILHYMILQMGLNMTVVPVGAIEPSNSTTPDGPTNIQGAFHFLQTTNVPGAFTVCTNPQTEEGEVVAGTNAFKFATAGNNWLQHIGGKLDGLTATKECRFNAVQANLLTKKIQSNIEQQKQQVNKLLANLSVPNPVIVLPTCEHLTNSINNWTTHQTVSASTQKPLVLIAQTKGLPEGLQANKLFRLPLKNGKSLHPITAWAKLIALQLLGTPKSQITQAFYTLQPWEGAEVNQLPQLLKLPAEFKKYGAYVAVTPTLTVDELAQAVEQLKTNQRLGNANAHHLILGGLGNGHIPIGYDTFMERFEAYAHTNATLLQEIKTQHAQQPITSIVALENRLTQLGVTEARVYLQDCFAQSHPILGALHQFMQQQGIEVWVGTTVPHGVADQAYSVGEMLHYMGVKTVNAPLQKNLKPLINQLKSV